MTAKPKTTIRYQVGPVLLVSWALAQSAHPIFGIQAQILPSILVALVAASCSFSAGGGVRSVWRLLAEYVALFVPLVMVILRLWEYPTLGVWLVCITLWALVQFREEQQESRSLTVRREQRIALLDPLVTTGLAVIICLLVASQPALHTPVARFASWLAAFNALYAMALDGRQRPRIAWRLQNTYLWLVWLSAAVAVYAPDFTAWPPWGFQALAVAIVATHAVSMQMRGGVVRLQRWVLRLVAQPETFVLIFFASVGLVGAIFLQGEVAQAGLKGHRFIDSLFTAVSAVCVTGLAVFDTPTAFSSWGHVIILLLMQIGGLGIISLSAIAVLIVQRGRASLVHEQTIRDMSGYRGTEEVKSVLRRILLYVFATEAIGVLLLWWGFWRHGDAAGMALWRAVFTAVSAFCNAGFALQSDSMVGYQNSSFVLCTLSMLIIAGGTSPLLAMRLPLQIRQKSLTLQESLVVTSTLVLLLIGAFLFLGTESSVSMQHLDWPSRMVNAFFQSASARTAGFNSLDFANISASTAFALMILMFIGGNPGSTAGGIKTVTASVLAMAVLSTARGRGHVEGFGRRIPPSTVNRALTVCLVGLLTGFVAFFMLSLTQRLPIVPLLFETVSALGTVGLSLGITSQLDDVGRIIIILCMLFGRVGTLTLLLILARIAREERWIVPEENVQVS